MKQHFSPTFLWSNKMRELNDWSWNVHSFNKDVNLKKKSEKRKEKRNTNHWFPYQSNNLSILSNWFLVSLQLSPLTRNLNVHEKTTDLTKCFNQLFCGYRYSLHCKVARNNELWQIITTDQLHVGYGLEHNNVNNQFRDVM